MRKIVSIVGGPLAALLCVGIAGAQAPQPRTTAPVAAPQAPAAAPRSKESTPNTKPTAPKKSGKKGAPSQKGASDDGDPGEAEGDDGAYGSAQEANEAPAPPPPPAAKPSAPRSAPQPASKEKEPGGEGPNSEAVDGPMVMGLMGGNINQMMRGGLMNMCPCATKSTLVQVSKASEGSFYLLRFGRPEGRRASAEDGRRRASHAGRLGGLNVSRVAAPTRELAPRSSRS